MRTATAGFIFLALLVLALAAGHVPLGDDMYRVCTFFTRILRVELRSIGHRRRPEGGTNVGRLCPRRARVLGVSILFLFIFQLVQGKLPLHLNDPATPMTPALAWNTAVSFVTNTNWQAYSGESTQGHWRRWPA